MLWWLGYRVFKGLSLRCPFIDCPHPFVSAASVGFDRTLFENVRWEDTCCICFGPEERYHRISGVVGVTTLGCGHIGHRTCVLRLLAVRQLGQEWPFCPWCRDKIELHRIQRGHITQQDLAAEVWRQSQEVQAQPEGASGSVAEEEPDEPRTPQNEPQEGFWEEEVPAQPLEGRGSAAKEEPRTSEPEEEHPDEPSTPPNQRPSDFGEDSDTESEPGTPPNQLPKDLWEDSQPEAKTGTCSRCEVCFKVLTWSAKKHRILECSHVVHNDCLDLWLGYWSFRDTLLWCPVTQCQLQIDCQEVGFDSKKFEDMSWDDMCCICFLPESRNKNDTTTLGCGHIGHRQCVLRLLAVRKQDRVRADCPWCRLHIELGRIQQGHITQEDVDEEVRCHSQEVQVEMAAATHEVERPTEAQVQYALWMVGAIEERSSDVNLEDRDVLKLGLKCFKQVSVGSHPDKTGYREEFDAFLAARNTIQQALASGVAPNGVREPTQATLAERPKWVGAAARAQRENATTLDIENQAKGADDFD